MDPLSDRKRIDTVPSRAIAGRPVDRPDGAAAGSQAHVRYTGDHLINMAGNDKRQKQFPGSDLSKTYSEAKGPGEC